MRVLITDDLTDDGLDQDLPAGTVCTVLAFVGTDDEPAVDVRTPDGSTFYYVLLDQCMPLDDDEDRFAHIELVAV